MNNNKGVILGFLVLVVVGAGTAYFYFSRGTQPPSSVSPNTANTATNKTSEWK